MDTDNAAVIIAVSVGLAIIVLLIWLVWRLCVWCLFIVGILSLWMVANLPSIIYIPLMVILAIIAWPLALMALLGWLLLGIFPGLMPDDDPKWRPRLRRRQEIKKTEAKSTIELMANQLGLSSEEVTSSFQKTVKRSFKFIMQNGGPAKICFEYWRFLQDYPLYQELGIVIEKDAPYPRTIAALSAIGVLENWKKVLKKGDRNDKYLNSIPEEVYIASCLNFDGEEIAELQRKAVGIVGRITYRDTKETAIGANVLMETAPIKKKKAQQTWLALNEQRINWFDLIQKL